MASDDDFETLVRTHSRQEWKPHVDTSKPA